MTIPDQSDVPSRVLLSPGARKHAAMSGIGCVVALAALGMRYRGESEARWLDRVLSQPLGTAGPHWHEQLWWVIHVGDPLGVCLLCACSAIAAVSFRRPEAVPLVLAAPLVSLGLAETVLKPMIGRTLEVSWSFPSGHTTGVSAVAATLIVTLVGRLRWPPGPVRALAVLAVAAFPIMMALALVALGLHYPTDTVAGWLLGVGVTLLLSVSWDWSQERWRRRR